MGITRLAPGSYTERKGNVDVNTGTATTATAGFVGVTVRGVTNKAIRVTSWKDFQDKFAYGYNSPLVKGNLAYGVLGFFNNGGSEVYITRVVGTGAKKATKQIPESTGITYTALEEGTWGNDINVDMKESATSGVFTLTVTIDGNTVEQITGLREADFVARINAESKFVNVTGDTLVAGNGALETGADGTIAVQQYKDALATFDVINDIRTCAIPGETDTGVQEAVLEYCFNRGDRMAVLDCPSNLTVEQALEYKNKFTTYPGAFYYPKISILDPLTNTVVSKGHAGHIAGLYARTDAKYGVHKAPAGMDATIVGALDVERHLTQDEIGILNSNNINCLVPERGHGIVVWGARLVTTDAERQFVSDLRLDIFVEQSTLQLTKKFVFEPKDDVLFNRVNATLKSFLLDCWNDGMLLGETPEEAFFTKCDRELNPDIMSSTLDAQIGYAKKKPTEFVVTQISHKEQL